MSYVVSFTDYTPVPRYPPVTTAWTQARIDESATGADGTWTTIDTITLSPVDSDPTDPRTRAFTTENATLPAAWYRVVFLDALGDEDITSSVYHPATSAASGAAYFTVEELRARFPDPLADDTTYTDEAIEAQRAIVEQRLERLCDVAFVPREVTETLSGDGSSYLEVRHTKPIAVTAATDDGSDVDLTDAALSIGTFYLPGGWNVGVSNLTVTYTHGYPEPPLAVKEAAMLWTRELVVKGPITDRATQIPTEDGGAINLATPGQFGNLTGYPAIDEVIAEYRYPSFVG